MHGRDWHDHDAPKPLEPERLAGLDAMTEVESGGNIAYESGTYELKTQDGRTADKGKYCVVWKKVNGQWMLHRDIWSTDMPAAAK